MVTQTTDGPSRKKPSDASLAGAAGVLVTPSPDTEQHHSLYHALNVSESNARRAYTKQSFYGFVQQFWDTIIPETPVWNWHIEYICNELQMVAERVFEGLPRLYDLIINVSPGSTKSTICSVMFPAWVWTNMPTSRVIGGSYTHPLALDLSRKGRDVVTSERYQECFPEIELRIDQQAKSYYVNTEGGSRYAVSVGGSVMGMHGHFLVVDDPIDPEKAISEVELKTAKRWMTETLPTRKVDKAVAPTILIMQRLHQDDPTQNMLDRAITGAPVRHICLPGELSDDIKPKDVAGLYVDGLMDPIRLSRKILKEARVSLGTYGYAGQIQQRPVPVGGGMFKIEKIRIESVAPSKWKQRVRYWDKAASHNAGAWTVGFLMGEEPNGRLWILDIIRGQWEMSARESRIKQTAQLDGRKVRIGVEQEPGAGGKDTAQYTVRNLRGFRVFADKVGAGQGSKEKRAEPFASQVNGGNVSMVRASWNKILLNELEYFPFSKYKDQVDSGSGAFNTICRPRTRVGGLR
jgi:predicted phage terminase large subunit-like protein